MGWCEGSSPALPDPFRVAWNSPHPNHRPALGQDHLPHPSDLLLMSHFAQRHWIDLNNGCLRRWHPLGTGQLMGRGLDPCPPVPQCTPRGRSRDRQLHGAPKSPGSLAGSLALPPGQPSPVLLTSEEFVHHSPAGGWTRLV